jgi:hypothetical protein
MVLPENILEALTCRLFEADQPDCDWTACLYLAHGPAGDC